jgi:PAS domain S-box-containing protein
MAPGGKRYRYRRREPEARLALLMDHAPAALALFDRDMRYLAASRRWLQDYGITGTPWLGRSHYEVFPEITGAWKQVHQRALAGETVRAEEDPFQRTDGTVQWLCWEVRPWRRPDGTVGGIVIFSEDITGRKKAEEGRLALQARLSAALESTTDAVYIADGQGRVIDFNGAFVAFYRFRDRDECLRSLDALQDRCEVWYEDGRLVPRAERALARALRGEVATNVLGRLRRKDTGQTWMAAYSYAPIRDAAGRVAGAVVVARDITAERRAEVALQESEGRYRELFQHAPVAVWEEDLSGIAARFEELRVEGVADLRGHLAGSPGAPGQDRAGQRRQPPDDGRGPGGGAGGRPGPVPGRAVAAGVPG